MPHNGTGGHKGYFIRRDNAPKPFINFASLIGCSSEKAKMYFH